MDSLLAWSTLALAIGTWLLAIFAVLAFIVAKNSLSTARTAIEEQRAAFSGQLASQQQAIKAQQDAIEAHAQAAMRANEWTRAEATLNYILSWRVTHEANLSALRELTKKHGKDLSSILQMPDQFDSAQKNLKPLLEGLEQMGLGVRVGAYDLNIVYQMARGHITWLWNWCRPYVSAVRTGQDASPNAYEHVEWLQGQLVSLAQREERDIAGRLTA